MTTTQKHGDAIIFLPKTNKARKRRYLHASRRRSMSLADWIYSVCDEACQLRCIECGGELSQCGEAGTDGEPTLDCKACMMKCDLQIKDARLREMEIRLNAFKAQEVACSR